MPNLPPALSLAAAIQAASPTLAAALHAASSSGGVPSGATEVFLDVSDIQSRYGISRATAWNWAKEPDFPKPIRLSGKCTRWRLSDLTAWEAAKAAA